jgi:hypothetical protein
MDDLCRQSEVSICSSVVDGQYDTDVIKLSALEDLIPVKLVCYVLNNDSGKLAHPFRMCRQHLFASCFLADAANDLVTRLDQLLDDVGRHEGVGAGDQCDRHHASSNERARDFNTTEGGCLRLI